MGWLLDLPVIYSAAGIVALIGAYLIWRNENRNPGVDTLAPMLVFAAVWVFSLGFNTMSTHLSTKLLWIKISFLGVVSPGTIAFISMNQFIHGDQWLSRRRLILLSLIPALTFLLALTNQFHGIMYQQYTLHQHGPYDVVTMNYGIGWWIFAIYNGALIAVGSMLLVSSFGSSWWIFPLHSSKIALLLGMFMPVGTIFIQVFNPEFFDPLKPIPIVAIFFGIIIAYSLENSHRKQLVSVSQNEIFDTIDDFIFVTDIQNRMIDMNENAECLVGKSLTNSIGQPINELLPEIDLEKLGQDGSCRVTLNHAGSVTTLETQHIKMQNWEGKSVNSIYILHDISRRAEMERQIKISLEEKETLLREIHHRAKNNLQVISSIFRLQSDLIKDQAMREAFLNSQERIQAIALVHENLYQSKGVNYIDFANYINDLTTNIIKIEEIPQRNVAIDIQVEKILIPYDLATPCGLIAYEIITNALKHAFPSKTRGTIQVFCKRLYDQQLLLRIRDDGVGIPQDMDINESKTLGFKLIGALVSQIQGNLKVSYQEGTSIEIVFPINEDL